MLYAAGLPNSTGTIYTGSVPIRVINLSLGSIGGVVVAHIEMQFKM